jgi:hypothetical protein
MLMSIDWIQLKKNVKLKCSNTMQKPMIHKPNGELKETVELVKFNMYI